MEIKTFDTILTGICDDFDSLISPRKISRSNTNIIYLMFKAISKGFEVINNVCVVLSNKFNPASCSEEDLVSVASLVGTEKLAGSASGLEIIAKNIGDVSATLLAGLYTYALDDDTSFVFEVLSNTTLTAGETKSYIAMSERIGSYPVTEQNDIKVEIDSGTIPEKIKFSCEDNSALLGTAEETNLAFRQRILTDTTRQDSIKELEIKLKNLPYLYDAKVVFNNTISDKVVASYTLPPFTMIIFFSGSVRNEMADIIASHSIYPTLQTNDSVEVDYVSDVFVDGKYTAYIIPFVTLNYKINVNYKLDTTYITQERARAEIRSFLESNFRGHIHVDYVREEDIYNKLKEFNVAGIDILNIDILNSNNEAVAYLEVPASDIPYLYDVTFSEV